MFYFSTRTNQLIHVHNYPWQTRCDTGTSFLQWLSIAIAVFFTALAYISVYWQYWGCMKKVDLGVFGDIEYFILIAPALILHPTILSKLSVLSYYLDVFLMGLLVKGTISTHRHRFYLRTYFLVVNLSLVSIPLIFFIFSGGFVYSIMMAPMPLVIGGFFFSVSSRTLMIDKSLS